MNKNKNRTTSIKATPMKISSLLIGVSILTATSPIALGQDLLPSSQATRAPEIRVQTGYANGVSGEYVYDAYGVEFGTPGYKMSELQWQLNNVHLLGIGASINPSSKIRFNADYWSNIQDGSGTMDDYDWLYIGWDWSHWSHHENTTVTDLSNLDLNTEIILFDGHAKKDHVTFLLGYKRDTFAWTATGGSGIYSVNSFRDQYVTFPNTKAISYWQRYSAPYFGFGFTSVSDAGKTPNRLSARIRYSNLVSAKDVDIHHFRDLRFEESGENGRWLSYELSLDFHLTRNSLLNIGYIVQTYKEVTASTLMTDLATGDKYYFSGPSAGLDHASRLTSIGLKYLF